MKSILDSAFKYTQAKDTDADYLRKKFRDIYDAQERARGTPLKVVVEIKPRVKGKANV